MTRNLVEQDRQRAYARIDHMERQRATARARKAEQELDELRAQQRTLTETAITADIEEQSRNLRWRRAEQAVAQQALEAIDREWNALQAKIEAMQAALPDRATMRPIR